MLGVTFLRPVRPDFHHTHQQNMHQRKVKFNVNRQTSTILRFLFAYLSCNRMFKSLILLNIHSSMFVPRFFSFLHLVFAIPVICMICICNEKSCSLGCVYGVHLKNFQIKWPIWVMWTNGFFYNSINRHLSHYNCVWQGGGGGGERMRTYACMRPVPANCSLPNVWWLCCIFAWTQCGQADDAEIISNN